MSDVSKYSSWTSSYSKNYFKGGYSWTETISGYDSESTTKRAVYTSSGSSWSWTRSGTVWDDGRNDWSESWSKSSWKDSKYLPSESESKRGSFDPKKTTPQVNDVPKFGEPPRLNKVPKNKPIDLNKPPKPSKDLLTRPPRTIKKPHFKLVNNLSDGGNKAPDPCEELIKKIIALGKELIERYDDFRFDDQDLYNRRRYISDPPVQRIVPLSGRRTTATGDPGSWEGHEVQYDKVKKELNKLLKDMKELGNCDDDDPDGYGGPKMQEAYDQALEYSQKEPPEQPDRRNQSSLLARANELGAQVRDGVLWVGAGVAGAVLFTLEVIAKRLGLALRSRP